MCRAMTQIVASQKKMLVRKGEDPNKISDEMLASLLERHLAQVEQWLSQQPVIRKLDVSYNQLLKNPRPHLEHINRFAGNILNVENMFQIINPDLYHQRHSD